ncbi:DNA polymerase III subunit delta [Maridesulfovibrio hydrothermalis]|uniref:DNA-directed DNA polymerase n=1 Tax=Maridesulfovibrio hydrothermalis AM13 = DSM 14728 TaxID=1121451 RepID=L0R8J7_9BACT|nr:DNA polymerase III delta [Maridesulfovibrio hydrothermalis]CCO22547.1 DNA polymerase III delta [Maridesulfovibrio hydrothermalis AM13 = DSM 14728]
MSRPGYMFLICPDAELLHARINELLEQSGVTDYEKKVYWADEELPAKFWDDLTLQTLFGSSKVVILRRAHKLKAATWDTLDKTIASLSDASTFFICLESKWERKGPPVPAVLKRRKCWKYAEKQKWFWQSAGLDEKTISSFVNKWARANGITIEGPVLNALTKALPRDARAARLELDKLDLAAGTERKVIMDHLGIIAHAEEMDFFQFMNAMSQGGDPVEVWRRVLTNHSEKDSMIFMLTASLTREARALWMMLHGEDSAVRLPPFVKKQKKTLAQRIGPLRIARLFDIVMEAEIGIKTGQRKPEQALELLVASLTSLFAAPQQNRRRY